MLAAITALTACSFLQVVALVIPRDSTPVNSSQGTGVSHVVATSIIIALILAIFVLITLHVFRKWECFAQHIKPIFCWSPRSTPVASGVRHDRVVAPVATLDRVISSSSSDTLVSSTTELQSPPKAKLHTHQKVELPMATRDTIRGAYRK